MLIETHSMSIQEQKDLINKLIERGRVINNGGGRLVFEHPDYEDRVVKIAMGEGGIVQNTAEADIYYTYSESYDVFANIYGHSELIVEMEKVEPFPDDLDYLEEGEERDKAWRLKFLLDDLIGDTADNEQLGLNECGEIVAYDYGYSPEKNCSEQTSELRDCYFDVDEYLSNLICILDGEIDMATLEADTLRDEEEIDE